MILLPLLPRTLSSLPRQLSLRRLKLLTRSQLEAARLHRQLQPLPALLLVMLSRLPPMRPSSKLRQLRRRSRQSTPPTSSQLSIKATMKSRPISMRSKRRTLLPTLNPMPILLLATRALHRLTASTTCRQLQWEMLLSALPRFSSLTLQRRTRSMCSCSRPRRSKLR